MKKSVLTLLFTVFVLCSQAQNEFDQYGPFGAVVYTDLKQVNGLENQVFKLDLNYVALDSKSLSKIQNLQSLQVLRMRNNGISRYPDNMDKLVNLMYFASYNNPFKEFLPNLPAYRSLHYLEIQHSKIDSIPSAIAYLRLLSSFKFGNTDDTLRLPGTLKFLKKLKDLSFENCILDSMPKQLFQLSSLQFLSLSNTGTKALSKHFERLPALEVLIVENNPISEIPFDLYKAQNLRVISLRGNKISRIPPSISHLEHLTLLDLRGNPMDPEEIEVLRALLPGCEVKF